MTESHSGASSDQEGAPGEPVVIRDKRRFDPVTGELRNPQKPRQQQEQGDAVNSDNTPEGPDAQDENDSVEQAGSDSGFAGAVGDDLPGGEQPSSPVEANDGGGESLEDELARVAAAGDEHPDTVLARERLEDVRRVQAEYVNYKRRVDRDRETQRDLHTSSMIESLLPVLDDFHLTRQHGDLEGTPFEKIADKLESTLGKYGVERFGEAGDAFDPTVHEALMNIEADLPEGADVTTVVQVMQPGFRIGDRIVRPARVAVADPK